MRLMGALLVMVVLTATACHRSADDADEHLTARAAAPDGLPGTCPEWDAPVRYAEGDLPDGALSVTLCSGPPIVAYDGTVSDVGIQSPEMLTTRVDELVATVNSLEAAPDDIGCYGDGGSRLAYWFGYPDGDVRAVVFESFGCEFLLVGREVRRLEGERLAQLFAEALLEQRGATTPQDNSPPPPDCRGLVATPGTALPQDPAELASASLCVEVGGSLVRQAEIPAPLLRRLGRGLLAEETSWDACTKRAWRHATILGYTHWGDLVRYSLSGCSHLLTPPTAGWLRAEEQVHLLSRDLATELESLPLAPAIRYTSSITRSATSLD